MLIKACLNGDRSRAEHPGVPVTPEELASAAEEAWPVLRWAQQHGYDVRAGLEDMVTGPDGQRVDSNADLLGYL